MAVLRAQYAKLEQIWQKKLEFSSAAKQFAC